MPGPNSLVDLPSQHNKHRQSIPSQERSIHSLIHSKCPTISDNRDNVDPSEVVYESRDRTRQIKVCKDVRFVGQPD